MIEQIEAVIEENLANQTVDAEVLGVSDENDAEGGQILGITDEPFCNPALNSDCGFMTPGNGDEVLGASAQYDVAGVNRPATGFLPETGVAANLTLLALGGVGLAAWLLPGAAAHRVTRFLPLCRIAREPPVR